MKKTALILLTIFLTAVACAGGCTTRPALKGSGRIITKELPAPEFHTLHASNAIDVYLTDKGDKIRIDADDNLMKYVTVDAHDGILRIGLDHRNVRHRHITVTVPTDGTIRSLRAASDATILSETALRGDEVTLTASSSGEIAVAVTARACTLDASSSGEIKAGIHADNCTIEASSSAEIEVIAYVTGRCDLRTSSAAEVTLRGEAAECVARCGSASELDAEEFAVRTFDIEAKSAAKAEIHCTERLRAAASSAATIEYRGDCTTDIRQSSAGSVRREH